MDPPFMIKGVHSLNCITIVVLTNTYGHPNEALLKRLRAVDSLVKTTLDQGALLLETDGSTYRITEWSRE